MTFNGRIATSLVMLALFVGACFLALDLPKKAAFMPLLIGVPGALLCLWQVVIDLRRSPDIAEAPEDNTGEEGQSEAQAFLWLGLFAVALIGFGFIVGGPVIVFAFVRFSSGESWKSALFAATGTFALLYGMFILLLELTLFRGLILEAIL